MCIFFNIASWFPAPAGVADQQSWLPQTELVLTGESFAFSLLGARWKKTELWLCFAIFMSKKDI